MTGLGELVAFFATRDCPDPHAAMGAGERAVLTGFVGLVQQRLGAAAQFELWCEPDSYAAAALPVFSARSDPFPLSWVLAYRNKAEVREATLGTGKVPDAATVRAS